MLFQPVNFAGRSPKINTKTNENELINLHWNWLKWPIYFRHDQQWPRASPFWCSLVGRRHMIASSWLLCRKFVYLPSLDRMKFDVWLIFRGIAFEDLEKCFRTRRDDFFAANDPQLKRWRQTTQFLNSPFFRRGAIANSQKSRQNADFPF